MMIRLFCPTKISTVRLNRSSVRWQSSLIPDALPPAISSSSISNLSGQFSLGLPPVPLPQQQQQQPPFVGLPTRHSRKRLPMVITDMVELTELASEIIGSDVGRLFTYNEYATNKKEATTRTAAWNIADVTVQKVESIIRGFSYLVPGTMSNRWVTAEQQKQSNHSPTPNLIDDIPASDILILQQQLLDRLIDEGHAYMTIRNLRMEHMHGKKGSSPIKGNLDKFGNRVVKVVKPSEDEVPKIENQRFTQFEYEGDDDEDLDKEDTYMYDFAAPGPTTAMYDTLLDTMASTASTITNRQEALGSAQHFHETIMIRHTNDGGDEKNDNVCTRPTAVSFNALIRIVAELPYDNSVNISTETSPVEEVEYRDEACSTFITTLQLMHECGVVHRNSASFKYALDCVGKYFPPSRIRGNVSTGLFQQARYVGLINDNVIASFIKANTPSNDEWNDNYIRNELQPGTWPVKWKRESRKLRYHQREDTY